MSHALLVETQNSATTLENNLGVSLKKLDTPNIQPTIALLSIYPREMKMYVLTNTCTWLFRTLLFVIARKWKQPKRLQYHRIPLSNKRR